MRSQEEVLARADALQRRLTDQTQHLSPNEAHAIAVQLSECAWMLGHPLDRPNQPTTPMEPDNTGSSIPSEVGEIDKQDTILSSPTLRDIGHSRLLMLFLPRVNDSLFPQAPTSVVLYREHAEMLTELPVPDPWGQTASPRAGVALSRR